jgi:hypothetical protein
VAAATVAWTKHYVEHPDEARARIRSFLDGAEVPVSEWLGATLALAPGDYRQWLIAGARKGLEPTDWYAQTFGECPHGYIKPYCAQCASEDT